MGHVRYQEGFSMSISRLVRNTPERALIKSEEFSSSVNYCGVHSQERLVPSIDAVGAVSHGKSGTGNCRAG